MVCSKLVTCVSFDIEEEGVVEVRSFYEVVLIVPLLEVHRAWVVICLQQGGSIICSRA